MSVPKCNGRHTKYQPPDSDWACPKCGAGSRITLGHSFIIDATEEGAEHDCPLLHIGDELACGCGHTTSGKAFAARLQKAANMVPCTHCKGHGLLPGAKVS